MEEEQKTDTVKEETVPTATTQETTHTKTREKKKRRIWLRIVSLLMVLFILIPVLIAGWLGFVPGLSNLMGSRTPKDLGVQWSTADFENYKSKTHSVYLDFLNAPDKPDAPGKKVVFAEPRTVKEMELTQEEITAAINNLNWAWLPAKNVQVKLENGNIEMSGNLNIGHVEDFVRFIGGVGYSDNDVSKAADVGRKLVNGAAFYAKGTASVETDQLTMNLQQIKIGRYSVPLDIAQNVIKTGGSNGIGRTEHLAVDSAQVGAGVLTFSGIYPTTIYVRH